MTTIILTVIGIILAAAAALMSIWYGGGAFDAGDLRSKTALLLTAGRNVQTAYAGYAMDGFDATSLDQLMERSGKGGWLHEMPVIKGAGQAQEIVRISGGWFYRVVGVPEEVCASVQRVVNAGAGVSMTPGSMRRGCAGAPGDRFFFARLDTSGSGTEAGPSSGSSGGTGGSSGGTGGSSGGSDGGGPVPPSTVLAAEGEPAACMTLVKGTGSPGGGRSGTESGIHSAYGIAQVQEVCSYLSAINGPGVCLYADYEIMVGYIVGPTDPLGGVSGSQYAASCKYKANAPVARPVRNAESGASCGSAFSDGVVSGGRSGPSQEVVDLSSAMSLCNGWASQYGEGACGYAWIGDSERYNVSYAIDAKAYLQPYHTKVVQCM